MRACQAAATAWNCLSAQSNLHNGNTQQGESREEQGTLRNNMHESVIPPATLQLDMQGGEWLHADHVVHDSCCIRVVCAIVEFVNGACWVFKALIPRNRKPEKSYNHRYYGIITNPSSHHQPLTFL